MICSEIENSLHSQRTDRKEKKKKKPPTKNPTVGCKAFCVCTKSWKDSKSHSFSSLFLEKEKKSLHETCCLLDWHNTIQCKWWAQRMVLWSSRWTFLFGSARKLHFALVEFALKKTGWASPIWEHIALDSVLCAVCEDWKQKLNS